MRSKGSRWVGGENALPSFFNQDVMLLLSLKTVVCVSQTARHLLVISLLILNCNIVIRGLRDNADG